MWRFSLNATLTYYVENYACVLGIQLVVQAPHSASCSRERRLASRQPSQLSRFCTTCGRKFPSSENGIMARTIEPVEHSQIYSNTNKQVKMSVSCIGFDIEKDHAPLGEYLMAKLPSVAFESFSKDSCGRLSGDWYVWSRSRFGLKMVYAYKFFLNIVLILPKTE